jgi:hypothetical protein
MDVEQRLEKLELVLPPAPTVSPGVEIPFAWVQVHGQRVLISGHGALGPDGTPQGPFGKVLKEITVQAAQHSARLGHSGRSRDLQLISPHFEEALFHV